jgi:hypothetical protein
MFTQQQVDEQVAQALKRERAISSAIMAGASPHQPRDMNAVVRLAQDAITVDDKGALVVLTEKGQTRYGSDGNPMSVSAFMGHFAQEHAYLFGAPGASSGRPTGQAAPHRQPKTGIDRIAMGLARLRDK